MRCTPRLARAGLRSSSVKLVGLGGGIGSGKSSVSVRLAARGAVIVDADVIARQVVEPGGLAYDALVERFPTCFGRENPDGPLRLDRAALAAVAFSDPDALAALNSITHPAINAVITEQIGAYMGTDQVVLLDAALLFDRARVGMVARVAVDVDPEVAIERLVDQRGFSESDARKRVAAQMAREERLAQADAVIDNSGTIEDLEREVDRIWAWIEGLPLGSEAEAPRSA